MLVKRRWRDVQTFCNLSDSQLSSFQKRMRNAQIAIPQGALLILSTKFRLMLYGMARLGPWQGALMYLGATIAILAVFAYVDGDVWKRLSFSL